MKHNLILLLAVIVFTGCSESTSDTGNQIDLLLAELRDATQSFHNFENAIEAGWETPLSPCVVHPQLGGMGYHYGRMEFFDGRKNHLEPQVLLYEPLENGGMEFIGVEYIIPFEIHPADSDPPVIFEQNYHANHDLGFWALHVWTEKENPGGMFTDFNPNVSCQFAND
jgi:hypothetical protein